MADFQETADRGIKGECFEQMGLHARFCAAWWVSMLPISPASAPHLLRVACGALEADVQARADDPARKCMSDSQRQPGPFTPPLALSLRPTGSSFLRARATFSVKTTRNAIARCRDTCCLAATRPHARRRRTLGQHLARVLVLIC